MKLALGSAVLVVALGLVGCGGGGGSSDSNNPPFAQTETVSLDKDTNITIVLQGSDRNGDEITYSVLTQPLHGTLSGVAPDLVYSPESGYVGQDTFTYRVNDGKLDSNIGTINLIVATYKIQTETLHESNGSIKSTTNNIYDMDANLLRSKYDGNADGIYEQKSYYLYNQDGTLATLKRGDTFEAAKTYATYSYDNSGKLTSEKIDENLDGSMDKEILFVYDSNGSLIQEKIDNGINSSINAYHNYIYQGGILVGEDFDDNADTNIDKTVEYLYVNSKINKASYDDNADSTADRVVFYIYDNSGRLVRKNIDTNLDGSANEYIAYEWVQISGSAFP